VPWNRFQTALHSSVKIAKHRFFVTPVPIPCDFLHRRCGSAQIVFVTGSFGVHLLLGAPRKCSTLVPFTFRFSHVEVTTLPISLSAKSWRGPGAPFWSPAVLIDWLLQVYEVLSHSDTQCSIVFLCSCSTFCFFFCILSPGCKLLTFPHLGRVLYPSGLFVPFPPPFCLSLSLLWPRGHLRPNRLLFDNPPFFVLFLFLLSFK